MKNLIIICFIIIFCQNASAEKIGKLFIGRSIFLGDYDFGYSDTQNLNCHGGRIGFYLPLSIPNIDTHFKFSAAKHAYAANRYYSSYVYATNEVLVGKQFSCSRLSFLPQAGVGIVGNIEYEKNKKYRPDFVDVCLSLSCITDYQFDGLNIGLLIDFYKGLEIAAITPSNRYLSISLIISK